MPYRSRATEKLLAGRISETGACYFLTWCTRHREKILASPTILSAIRTSISSLEASGDGSVLAATVMPDHIHLLVDLTGRLSLSQLVAKVKSTVTRQGIGVHWQLNFFEHRLRHQNAPKTSRSIFL